LYFASSTNLYDYYLNLSLEARVTSKAGADDSFGCQTYFSRRLFQEGVIQASQSLRVKIQGQKPQQQKNKRSKKKKSKAKKKLEITYKEEYMLSFKTVFAL